MQDMSDDEDAVVGAPIPTANTADGPEDGEEEADDEPTNKRELYKYYAGKDQLQWF